MSGSFLGIAPVVSSKFWHGARNPYKVVHDRSDFPQKKNLPPKLGKWTKNGRKTWFFEFIENFLIFTEFIL